MFEKKKERSSLRKNEVFQYNNKGPKTICLIVLKKPIKILNRLKFVQKILNLVTFNRPDFVAFVDIVLKPDIKIFLSILFSI